MASIIKEALVWLNVSGFKMEEQVFRYRSIIGGFIVSLIFILQFLQIFFSLSNIDRVASIIEVAASLNLALIKIFILTLYRKEIGDLITQCYQYWPTNKFDDAFDKELQSIFKTVKFMLICYRWLAIVTVTMIVTLKPYLSGKGGLPIEMWQPFDMMVTPWYQIVYVLQSFVGYFASCVNIAVDSLYVAFMTNTICQFKICGRAFQTLKFAQIKTREDEQICWNEMKICIEYHNHLIRIVDKIQTTFSLVFFNMFGVGTITVCIDLYFVAYDGSFDFIRIVKYFFQCSFFVFLLFSYCFAGNQLTHQCIQVSDDMYFSEWYCQPSPRIKKGVLTIIQRTQQMTKLTAGGLMQLDLENFIRMLRLAFSFFTLIRTQAVKKTALK